MKPTTDKTETPKPVRSSELVRRLVYAKNTPKKLIIYGRDQFGKRIRETIIVPANGTVTTVRRFKNAAIKQVV